MVGGVQRWTRGAGQGETRGGSAIAAPTAESMQMQTSHKYHTESELGCRVLLGSTPRAAAPSPPSRVTTYQKRKKE